MGKLIAVYGSLKKGKYNNPLLEDSEFLGDTKVKGTLYGLGGYPALLEDGDIEYPAEIYRVSDSVYERIRGMELGAGYKEVEVMCPIDKNTSYDCIVYYADDGLSEYCKKNRQVIESY